VLLSEEKTSHLSHLVLGALKKENRVRLLQDEGRVLREIRRTIEDEVRAEESIDEAIRKKIASYSRPIYEGSPEWEVLYQKFFQEEAVRRGRK
jgi:hypothetical protein